MQINVLNSNSDGNCIVLTDDNGKMLLLDAGVTIKKIKEGIDYNISDLVGAIISHKHNDHAKSVKDLKAIGTSVFTPYTREDYKPIKTKLGDFVVTAIPMVKSDGTPSHTNADGTDCKCYGFLIEQGEFNLLYITDTMYCKYRFNNIQNIIVGTNYQMDKLTNKESVRVAHVLTGHLSIDNCLELLKANNPSSNVILSHLSLENADAEGFLSLASEVVNCPVYIAKAGLTINL